MQNSTGVDAVPPDPNWMLPKKQPYLFDLDLNPVRPTDMPEDMPIFGWFAPLRLVYRADVFDRPSETYVLGFGDRDGWRLWNDVDFNDTSDLCRPGIAKYEAYGVFLIHKDVFGTKYAKLWRIVGYGHHGSAWAMEPDGSVEHVGFIDKRLPPNAFGAVMVELGVMDAPTLSRFPET